MCRLPEARIAPPETRELRELVQHRAMLVPWRSALKASVHAVLANSGVAVPMSDLAGSCSPTGLRVNIDHEIWPDPISSGVDTLEDEPQ